jgi:hypothetical protein
MGVTSDANAIRELEARLRRPDRGESGYREGAETRNRIDTVARLREFAEEGKIERRGRPGGINTHIHTAKSFSFFASPSEAVWQAYVERLAVLGINDHNTLAGHEEFGKACRAAGIRPAFSMEAIAMWGEAQKKGDAVNDAANPGQAYLSAKGVTRAPGPRAAADLEHMNQKLRDRNREITGKLARLFATRLGIAGAVTWDGVLALTPHGQPTERHVVLLAARALEASHPEPSERNAAAARLAGEEPPEEAVQDSARLQDFLRAMLLKKGKPAHVKESPEAFLPIARLVELALELGANPAYPVLGDPVTPWEEDLDRLLDRLESLNIHALEVIPNRNTRERLQAIIAAAAARQMPVMNGTEHNTATPMPLVDKFFFDDEFRPHFERGARVLLGHQALRAAGKEGYVRDDGSLGDPDREANLNRVEEAGRRRGP